MLSSIPTPHLKKTKKKEFQGPLGRIFLHPHLNSIVWFRFPIQRPLSFLPILISTMVRFSIQSRYIKRAKLMRLLGQLFGSAYEVEVSRRGHSTSS